MKNLANFHQTTPMSQLELWCDLFIQSSKKMNLRFTEELCFMTMNHDAKFEKDFTCRFKINMRNLTNFDPIKNLHFNAPLLTKVYNFWVKKVQRSYVWWHWILMQNLKENWLVLSKMTWRIWQIFTGWKITTSCWKVKWRNKTLFYLGNKWIAQLTKLFTHVL